MSTEIKAASGQGWSRAAVAVGVGLSVAGNATETVLTTSPVHLAIRIVIAISLPALVGIAVEVFVRVAWRRRPLDFTGRAMLLVLPAFGAAYVSFGHLYSLSRLSGSDPIAASANALAIDGLMIGGTVALLAIRAARIAEAEVAITPTPAPDVIEAPAPDPLIEPDESEPRAAGKPRAPKEAQEKAVRMLLDGASVEAASEDTGVGMSTLRLYAKAMRMLITNPAAEIGPKLDGRSINPALVDIVRAWANREGRVL